MASFFSQLYGFKQYLTRNIPGWLKTEESRDRAARDKKLIAAIRNIVGKKPRNIALYRLAIKHISMATEYFSGYKESNERLEFLGDAVLGNVVADFLFKKFPYKHEGFLTEIRSRIVSREALNNLGNKIGVNKIIDYDAQGDNIQKNNLSHKSISGDTLEALIGAVYLDHGFYFCKSFIINRLIIPHFDLNTLIKSDPNHKSKIIEWAQKNNKEVRFDIIETKGNDQNTEFVAQVTLDDQPFCTGSGLSKKKAEQVASRKTCEMLEIED